MSDVLIIGAGIAGLSLAARLAPHMAVTVLEAEAHHGYHASGRSAALYEANYGLPSTVALNKASGGFFRDHNYLTPRGLMLLAGRDDRAGFEHDCADLGLSEITVDAARDMVPILDPEAVAFAAHHAGAWDIDTDLLMQDHIRTITGHGGQVITSARVREITKTAQGWTVTTAAGDYSAALLVNAGGAWADEVAALAGVAPIGITPMRRSMARIAAPDGRDLRHWPMLMGVHEAWYAKPDAGALIVSPAEQHPTHPHDAWADDMVLAEGLARYQAMVTPEVTRPIATWAGLRSFAPDRALVLGRAVDCGDFVWCAGQGGYGFQTSPAASQLLADIILGHAPALDGDLIAALSPERFQ